MTLMSSAAMVRLLSLLVVVSVHSFSLYRETHKDVEKITFTCIPYHATGLLSLEALEYIVEPCFKVRLQELGITKQSKKTWPFFGKVALWALASYPPACIGVILGSLWLR